MYKLIIVDDEEIIRVGLREHIDWASIGFEVVDTFEDGADAISFLSHTSVDAIFTDIQMYQISGIELAKYVKEHTPETKVVALSNYREFDYVKQSLANDVCDYILKPIDPDEVLRTFQKIYNLLQKERYFKGNSSVNFAFYTSEDYKKIETSGKQLQTLILDGKVDSAFTQFKQWFRQIRILTSPYQLHIILKFFNDLNECFQKNGFHIPNYLETESIMNRLNQLSFDELSVTLEQTIAEYCSFHEKYENITSKNLIETIKEYIQTHFSKKLSLDEIAQRFYLNPSYLSREFKRQTGVNISQYILDCKMQAVFLLISENKNYSVEEIAGKVGYYDVRYFHRIFKQYTGHSVKEYQRILNLNKEHKDNNGDA